MGGHAFPEFKTRRLDQIGFMTVATACMGRLEIEFPSNHFQPVVSYRNKETFGDLDIIWCGDHIATEDMCKALKAIDFVKNGPVTSFALRLNEDEIFQVDLIYVDCKHLESSASYFAFNDLGNLLGRIFHRAGFKLGHKGLLYVVREEGNSSHALKEIEVTRSWKEALEFAGYDFNRWFEGFDELEDVFRYAVSIPLANRTIFRLDETNHQARVRDRKRLTYQKFLHWVNDPANGVKEHEDIPKAELREKWLERAKASFPRFAEELEVVQKEMEARRRSSEKFNGLIVREITGLDGKELGQFMQDFVKNHIEGKMKMTKVEWALKHSSDHIRDAIKEWQKG